MKGTSPDIGTGTGVAFVINGCGIYIINGWGIYGSNGLGSYGQVTFFWYICFKNTGYQGAST